VQLPRRRRTETKTRRRRMWARSSVSISAPHTHGECRPFMSGPPRMLSLSYPSPVLLLPVRATVRECRVVSCAFGWADGRRDYNAYNCQQCAIRLCCRVLIALPSLASHPLRLVPCLLLSVGVFKNGRVEIIANDQGNRITPSYVAFTEEGERLVGDAAKNQVYQRTPAHNFFYLHTSVLCPFALLFSS
jgi:hypothetical protein